MRTIEIIAENGTAWTIEIQEIFEQRIASTLKRDPYAELSDEEIKDFILNHLMNDNEMLSLEVVDAKG